MELSDVSTTTLLALSAVTFVAAAIDAVAGGGGLLTIPAFLAAGFPPQFALGTNKAQSVFGSFAAFLRYRRAGLVDTHRASLTFPAGIVGSFFGAVMLLQLDPRVLKPVVLILLVVAGALVVFARPATGIRENEPSQHSRSIAIAIALIIGTYDGFFGPGTGTFLIVAFVRLLHLSMPRATADAKVVNFASNLAAVALFASRGIVLWGVALPMAVAQFLGGFVGAHLAVRRGERFIRGVVFAVVLALVAKLCVDLIKAR